MSEGLSSRGVARLTGFGGSVGADGYRFAPTDQDQILEILDLARRSGRNVALRGLGRSYGDAAFAAEQIVLDMTGFNRVHEFDAANGVIRADAGLALGDLWRETLPHGWWPPVVTGTQYITLGGAVAMNVHGKNQFSAGALIRHVAELDVLKTNGEVARLTPDDPACTAVIGGAGLVGIILRVTLRLHRVGGGMVWNTPFPARTWNDQFEIFSRESGDAEYLVSWIDAFGNGRGIVHRADYRPDSPSSGTEAKRVSSLAGVVLRAVNRRSTMRAVNAVKYQAGFRERAHLQSLPDYSFLLDAVPDWQRAYGPAGFLQFQPFVPRDAAPEVFARLIEMQRQARRENFLTVLKRHQPDDGLLSPYIDGYSLAMDFPMRPDSDGLHRLLHQMVEVVLQAGGRFYLAKDQILTADEFRASLPPDRLARFAAARAQFDPEGLLGSAMADRLRLA